MKLLLKPLPILAFALLAAAPLARAEDIEPAPCASERPLTERLVRDAQDLHALAGRTDILVGGLSYLREPSEEAEAASGAVIFVKRAGAWRAIMPQNFEDEVGLYASDAGSLIVLTQHRIEGPGQSFVYVRTDDGFAATTCATIAFPAALNRLTWNNETLEPHALNLSANGRGTLIASAEVGREGKSRTLWFSYTTRDGGRTWRAPMRIAGPRMPAGVYHPAIRSDGAALIADLTAAARGK